MLACLLLKRQKVSNQVGTGCPGQGFIAEISGEMRWGRENKAVPHSSGAFEGFGLFKPCLSKSQTWAISLYERGTRCWERNNVNQIASRRANRFLILKTCIFCRV